MPHCVICGEAYVPGRVMTCSDKCHDEMKRIIIKNHGKFKKVVDHKGIAYRVPTEDIIEHGIEEKDLGKYPRWEDTPAKGGTPLNVISLSEN
jgi:hypothetical protein